MKHSSKRALQFVTAGVCAVLVLGCETISTDLWLPAVGAAGDPTLTVSRARVEAELREASRLGLITVGEETARDMTAEEIRLVARAGDEAVVAEASAPKAK